MENKNNISLDDDLISCESSDNLRQLMFKGQMPMDKSYEMLKSVMKDDIDESFSNINLIITENNMGSLFEYIQAKLNDLWKFSFNITLKSKDTLNITVLTIDHDKQKSLVYSYECEYTLRENLIKAISSLKGDYTCMIDGICL